MPSQRTLKAISAHARSLDQQGHEDTLSDQYADVCVQRQIEVREQELRDFVVRHSVFRIHGVSALAMALLVWVVSARFELLNHAEIVLAVITVASLVIAASAYSIGIALGRSTSDHSEFD